MKHRKLMAMLLSLVIALTFMPAVAFADDEAAEGTEPAAATELQGETAEQSETPEGTEPAKEEQVSSKEISANTNPNYYYSIGGEPQEPDVDVLPTTTSKWSYDGDSQTLTLNGYNNEDVNILFKGFDLKIEVIGSNSVNAISVDGDIFGDKNNLEIMGDGTLSIGDGVQANSVTINGGTVNLNKVGINAQGTITINSGTITIGDGAEMGLYANSDVIISGGNIDINAQTAGIHSSKNIKISGGNVTIAANWGISAPAPTGKIIISGNKTRVEASCLSTRWGSAIQAGNGIEILDPLYIKLPVNGKVDRERSDHEEGNYTIFESDGATVAKHVVIEPRRETYDILIATAKANGKESIDLSWNKLDSVDGYDVFFSRCNTKKQKYTCEYAGSTDGSATAWSKADLKRRTPYKMYVMAYVMSGDSKTYVAKSPTVHAYTGGGTGRYTNPKSVKVKKSKVTVKKNKTYKIKASVRKLRKGKKLINGSHARKLRYLSSNTSVATVTRYGKIKGVAPGTCDVYVLAVNGSYKKVAVTVK